MANDLVERLKRAVKKDGRSPRAISQSATGNPDAIRDIYRHKAKSPKVETVLALSEELGVDLIDHDGDYPHSLPTANSVISVPMLGFIQAGAFMDREDLVLADDKPQFVGSVADDAFPNAKLFALKILGDSINLVCAEGGHAICVPFEETGLTPRNEMWVVVERSRGDLVERTIKRLHQEGRTLELRPASSNPRHKAISLKPSADQSVRIVALVRRFIGPTLTW